MTSLALMKNGFLGFQRNRLNAIFFSRKLRQSHAKKRLKCGLGSLPS